MNEHGQVRRSWLVGATGLRSPIGRRNVFRRRAAQSASRAAYVAPRRRSPIDRWLASVVCVKLCKRVWSVGGCSRGLPQLFLAEFGEEVHVEVAAGLEPVLVGLDVEGVSLAVSSWCPAPTLRRCDQTQSCAPTRFNFECGKLRREQSCGAFLPPLKCTGPAHASCWRASSTTGSPGSTSGMQSPRDGGFIVVDARCERGREMRAAAWSRPSPRGQNRSSETVRGESGQLRPPSLSVLWYEMGYGLYKILFLLRYWRRGRDSNPRWGLAHTPLAGERLQPLGHLSVAQRPCWAARIV